MKKKRGHIQQRHKPVVLKERDKAPCVTAANMFANTIRLDTQGEMAIQTWIAFFLIRCIITVYSEF